MRSAPWAQPLYFPGDCPIGRRTREPHALPSARNALLWFGMYFLDNGITFLFYLNRDFLIIQEINESFGGWPGITLQNNMLCGFLPRNEVVIMTSCPLDKTVCYLWLRCWLAGG
jgi:hypothetical protein